MHNTFVVRSLIAPLLPGGTVGYPAHPRLICPSICLSVRQISFNYSAENCLGPTDSVNKYVKIMNRRGIVSQIFFKINLYIDSHKNQGKSHNLLRLKNVLQVLNLQKYLLGQIFLGNYYNYDSHKNQGGIMGKTMTQNATKNDEWEQCYTKHNALKIYI